ncbi:DUF7219 family protein [Nodularia sphaerocarpa]|uniref:DUF7219 family protein n=1 Tax=Nodularia sphaerocarpa TaxID=137816 RepID=UPI001EFA9235|nr:hypothetical protein [Nodularia sphaerocarpa]MDB9373172.1 hypothetical protein [Nodularia sphaerocarpa CS-585]MDB9379757.1 hypothetical protein [Nodularia sphaerocarpa CS-585A2]ULP70667.1 hypothetical protein BDGGKGIB_00283 [Nodularia sphaerocarpa UHCC 0038]
MAEPSQDDKNNFIYPRSRYYGQFQPEHLVFNANLQEFAQRVGYISNLETSGKLTPEQAYKKIKVLWKQLKRSKKQLSIGKEIEPPSTP